MTMEAEILTAMRKIGRHADKDQLHAEAGRVHKMDSFNTALWQLKEKKTIRRFDLRNMGGKFVYGLPEWGEPPELKIAEPVARSEPIDQQELRRRLEEKAGGILNNTIEDMKEAVRSEDSPFPAASAAFKRAEDPRFNDAEIKVPAKQDTAPVKVDSIPGAAVKDASKEDSAATPKAAPAPDPARPSDGFHRFEIPIPGKRSAMFSLPKDLEPDDVDMVMVMIEAFAKRAYRRAI